MWTDQELLELAGKLADAVERMLESPLNRAQHPIKDTKKALYEYNEAVLEAHYERQKEKDK